MANIAHNSITVKDPIVLQQYLNDNGNFDPEKVVPRAADYIPQDRWSNWESENLGTRWMDYLGISEDGLKFSFDSAWQEPYLMYEEMCRQNPDAAIHFHVSIGDGGGYLVREMENHSGELIFLEEKYYEL